MPTNRNGSKWHLSILLEQVDLPQTEPFTNMHKIFGGATPVPAGEQKTAGKTTVTTEEPVKKTTVKSTTTKRTTKSTKKGTNS